MKKKDRKMSNGTEQEFAKYIALRWQGREQETVFPFSMQHAEVFRYMKREAVLAQGGDLGADADMTTDQPIYRSRQRTARRQRNHHPHDHEGISAAVSAGVSVSPTLTPADAQFCRALKSHLITALAWPIDLHCYPPLNLQRGVLAPGFGVHAPFLDQPVQQPLLLCKSTTFFSANISFTSGKMGS
ncbi:MAG: hypothetical protein WCQ21_04815 [Verrucomicrobiota bacterium]